MAEEKQGGWLRFGELIAGIIILVIAGYVIAYPGAAAATLIALLAIALIILAIWEFVRIFSEGISGWRRLLRLILSIIVFIIAATILVYPAIAGTIVLGWLLAIALIIGGIVWIARGTAGHIIAGIIAVIIGIVAIVLPGIGVGLIVLLLAVGLIILGLELIISGIAGRWV